MIYVFILKLFLGLSLFFIGMGGIKDSFYKLSGSRLEYFLTRLTKNIIMSIITGMVITMVLQSSSAITVIVISLVNARMLSLEQAFGVIMGSNIGTTITVQFLSFNLEEYLWVFILIGILLYILYYFTRRKSQMYIARGVLGFSMLLLGLNILSTAMVSCQDIELFIGLLSKFNDMPLLGIFAGVIITAIIQSSSALTGIVLALAKISMINLSLAIALALGSNIGTCITALLASFKSSKAAKRAALAHVLFNFFGVLVIIPILSIFTEVVLQTSDKLPRQIANAHTIFNIFNTLIVLPIRALFLRFILKIT